MTQDPGESPTASDDPVGTGPERDQEKLAYRMEKVAELLDVSYWTIRGLIRSGRLAHIKVGKYNLVPHTEIERFLEDQKVPKSA
ncbi:helix-turn-helix domain-containing protein [Amycolatopsis sp. NPDC006131]|uniref:helix-turn-helix domain-containing protein n=1 Tax=Amycolatopsis sp. NPDC006131 TaxID=3156731 RepID=UPI0033A13626